MVSNKMKVKKLQSKTSLDYTSRPLFFSGIVKRVDHARARARENCLPRGDATRGGKQFSRLPTWYVRFTIPKKNKELLVV